MANLRSCKIAAAQSITEKRLLLFSIMLDDVVAAFERQDYQAANQLLQPLLQENPQNLWVQFYVGRLHEVSGEIEAAQKIYLTLLRDANNQKLMVQARQGLQRLEVIIQEQKQKDVAQATTEPNSTQLGVLVLEPIGHDDKTIAAQKFAQIMQIDSYTARLKLPSRGWRLYKSGAIGELKFWGQQLKAAEIPCFWTTLAEIQQIRVFQVSYYQSVQISTATVFCQNEQGQMGALTFDWSEVSDRVMGLLPIFEQVVDRNARGKLQRKIKTQDYAHFCDLIIPSRQCILRLHDNSYQYDKGVTIADSTSQTTIRINWNSLLDFLPKYIPAAQIWSDFAAFGESVIDQPELLERINPHIHLLRRTQSNWDSAFQLYSALILTKASQ